MKKASSVIWGILLIAAGVIFALNTLNIADIDIFFSGWWTLFIIAPCGVGLFTEREKTGNIIGIAIGVFLLLCCQDILFHLKRKSCLLHLFQVKLQRMKMPSSFHFWNKRKAN